MKKIDNIRKYIIHLGDKLIEISIANRVWGISGLTLLTSDSKKPV